MNLYFIYIYVYYVNNTVVLDTCNKQQALDINKDKIIDQFS